MRYSVTALLAFVALAIASPVQGPELPPHVLEARAEEIEMIEQNPLVEGQASEAEIAFRAEAKQKAQAAAKASQALTQNMHQEFFSRLKAAHETEHADGCTGLLCSLGIDSGDIASIINATKSSDTSSDDSSDDSSDSKAVVPPFLGYPGYPSYGFPGYGGYGFPGGYCPTYGYGGYYGGYGGYYGYPQYFNPYNSYGCGGGGGDGGYLYGKGYCPLYNPYYGGYSVPNGYPKPGSGNTDCKDVNYNGWICSDAYDQPTYCYGDAKGDYTVQYKGPKCSYIGACAASDDGDIGFCIC